MLLTILEKFAYKFLLYILDDHVLQCAHKNNKKEKYEIPNQDLYMYAEKIDNARKILTDDVLKFVEDFSKETKVKFEYMINKELVFFRFFDNEILTKPITNDKLMEALESFVKSYDDNKIYNLTKNWIFDSGKSIVSNGNEDFILTKKESIFLKLLIIKNRVITYEELESHIWDEDSIMTSNAMRLFIKNLRKKLPENFLKNMQGVGYYHNKI